MMTADEKSTAVPAANGQPAKAPRLTKEQLASLARDMYAGFGQVTTVLMRSVEYRHAFLSELEWLVVPSVLSSQYSIASAEQGNSGLTSPQAVVLWAHVSETVDKRLTSSGGKPRLRPDEWTSGQIPWLIEVAGDTRAASMLLRTVVEQKFAKTGLKTMERQTNGQYKERLLGIAVPPAAANAAKT